MQTKVKLDFGLLRQQDINPAFPPEVEMSDCDYFSNHYGRLVAGDIDRLRSSTSQKKILELGPGDHPLVSGPNVTYLDIRPLPLPNFVQWDMEDLPLPFEDNSFDEVYAFACLEHVSRFPCLMAEIHRIIRPSGILRALTIHMDEEFRSGPCFEHYRLFSERTFWQFDRTRMPKQRWKVLKVRTLRFYETILSMKGPGRKIRSVQLRRLFYLFMFLPRLLDRYHIYVEMTPAGKE